MPATLTAERKRCFEPVVDERTRLLVLGSLPSEKSLALGQYYGNPQNRFWMLMGDVTGAPLHALDYPSRLQTLLTHGIGLWDVVAQAHRPGSLDSRIRDRDDNDLIAFLAGFPTINAIAFNGGTASRLGIKALGELVSRYRVIELPSSSPAYTKPYTEKLDVWATLRQAL